MIPWFVSFVPLILSLTVQFSIKSKPEQSAITPPGWVFTVVWTFIYLLYGWYLYRLINHRHNLSLGLFSMNMLLGLLWTPLVFTYNRKVLGLYIIYIKITLLAAMMILSNTNMDRLLLLPYIAWLFVASDLQIVSIQKTKTIF